MLLGPLRAPPDRHFTVYSSGVRGQEKVKCSAVNGGEEGPEVLRVIGAEALLRDLNTVGGFGPDPVQKSHFTLKSLTGNLVLLP